jgi:hypothetical protein
MLASGSGWRNLPAIPLLARRFRATIPYVRPSEVVVNRRERLFNVAIVLVICFIGAMLMTAFDHRGTRLLKFFGYLILFASISSPAVFSSHHSCSAMLRRLRKQS